MVTAPAPVVLLGPGRLGREFLLQLCSCRQFYLERFGLDLRVKAVLDRSSALVDSAGALSASRIAELVSAKRAGRRLDKVGGYRIPDANSLLSDLGAPGTLFVDCTNGSEMGPLLVGILDRGGKIVLANKKPLTQGQSQYERLTQDPSSARWETTVASCLPVITVVNRMIAGGDRVERILGSMSGTAAYLMTCLESGEPFSQILRHAVEEGYTEPFPQDDLSGMDLARKALILARGCGWKCDLEDVVREPLVPPESFAESGPGILLNESILDSHFQARSANLQQQGRTLRYVASIARDRVQVRLTDVSQDSPMGRLKGSDNLIEIHSEVYRNPLVLQGRGIGLKATASGLLSDVIELAFTRNGPGSG